jgi:uncharacterized protein (TIGR02145 family)
MSNWKIGNTDIEDYGVHVQSSSNILDMPAWQDRNDGTNWINEHYKEYWQSTTDIKDNDREIVLNCWIAAGDYSDFLSKLASFYTLTEARNFTLITPLGSIPYCYITSGISTIRETNYRAKVSIGVFTLRITVTGDYKENTVLIYPHAGGVTPKTAILTSNLKVSKRLRGEMYATCTCEQVSPINITRGDMIAIPVAGTSVSQYENFYLVTDPEIKKVSTNKYSYNLRFEHSSYYLKNVSFKSLNVPTPEEGDFYWFADLEEVIDKIIQNCTGVLDFTIIKGTVESTAKKNHKFSGENCWDVLQTICNTYEMEWDFVSSANASHGFTLTLNVKERIERTWPYTLEYGHSEGLYELTRDSFNRDELCTVLYAWGSEKNLKSDYIYRRLKCPEMPMYTAATGIFGTVQKTVFFDDYFPEFSCTVAAYYQVLPVPGESVYESIKEQWPDGIYRITADASLTFDPTDEDHRIGLRGKVAMRTGDLAGFEFEITRYDATGNYLFIKPSVDEYAGTYPGASGYPGAGDEFTFIDISQDDVYVTSGEARLYAAASAYLSEYSSPKLTYRVTVDPAFIRFTQTMYPEYAGFNIGDSIFIIDTDLDMNKYFRVSDLSKDCYTGKFELTLSEREILTNRERTQQRISILEKFQNAVKALEPETAKNNQETTAELRRRLFDESDRKLAVNDIVRDESLDPGMLAFDSGVPQFMVNGCLVSTNYENLVNRVHISDGTIDILNWPANTLDRYDIHKKDLANEQYDPTRTWTMAVQNIDLPDNGGYYIVAKLPRDEGTTAGTWYATGETTRVKFEPDYIQYTAGYINPPTSKRQAAMLWGNRKILELPGDGYPNQILMKASTGEGDAVWSYIYDIEPRLYMNGTAIYLHSELSDVTGHQALPTAPDDSQTTYSASGFNDEILIAEFITNAGYPGVEVIPAGTWLFDSWAAVSVNDNCRLTTKVYKCGASGENETELFNTLQLIPETVITQHIQAVPNGQFEMGINKRLKLKYYAWFDLTPPRVMYLAVEGNASGEFWHSNVRIPDNGIYAGEDNYVDGMTFDNSTRTLTLNRTGTLADLQAIIPDATGEDNYVNGATFDETTRDLTLQRTGILSDIVVNIPCDIISVVQGAVTNVEYGNLYNWYAATDARNIAPVGFHVPTKTEFETLETFVGGRSIAGGKLKETGLTHWSSPNTGATNEYGFNGRGAGYRASQGVCTAINGIGMLWSSSTQFSIGAARQMTNGFASLDGYQVGFDQFWGCSIRYIKDDSTDPGTVTGNDGKVYPTVKIGNQVWTAANSAETKYRDGSLITGPTFTNVAWAALTTEAYCIYEDNPDNAIDGIAVEHNLLSGLQGGNTAERYHHTADEIADHVYDVTASGSYVRTLAGWELSATGGSSGLSSYPIEFGFNDVEAGTAKSWDLDINVEFPYQIKHSWLRTDTGSLSGVNVAINGSPVSGLDNISVTSAKSKSTAASSNTVSGDETVTLNITTAASGDVTYIGGHVYIEMI